MKKIIFLSFLLIVSFSHLKAVPWTCYPDCIDDKFQFNLDPEIMQIGGCTITVNFGYRIACETWYDYCITGINLSPDPDNPTACDNLEVNQLMHMVMVMLIQRNPANFPKPTKPGDCATSWRINRGLCWRFFPSSTNDDKHLGMCDIVECCLTWYRICMDNYGREIITIEDEQAPVVICPYNPPCIKVCD